MATMYWIQLVVFVTFAIQAYTGADYSGYKVARIFTTNWDSINVLNEFLRDDEMDFWIDPAYPEMMVEVLLSPDQVEVADDYFRGMQYTFINDDLQAYLEPLIKSIPPLGPLNLDKYNSLIAIEDWLEMLPGFCPGGHTCTYDSIGTTSEGRAIRVFEMRGTGKHREAIVLDAALHGREWITTATMLKLINHLVFNYYNDESAMRLAQDFDWIFIPVANPDGYHYTFAQDPLWSKNRRPAKNNTDDCVGTDLNRNFKSEWGKEGSGGICSRRYPGPAPESEPETKAIAFKARKLKGYAVAWLSLQAYGYYWLHPYGTTTGNKGLSCQITEHVDEMQSLAKDISLASRRQGHKAFWSYGGTCEFKYKFSGGITDFVHTEVGIKHSYYVELSGPQFQPPEATIERSFQELWAGLQVLADRLSDKEVEEPATEHNEL